MTDRAVPSLSILLSSYEGEVYLEKQLDSILAQTFGDFELLAVDDGSSDGTPAILASYAARDRRIRVLPGGGNLGQKGRLWQLTEASRTPLLSVADQDDVWHPDKTQRLVEALGSSALAYGRSELVDADGTPIGATLIESVGPAPRPSDRLSLLFFPRVSAHAMIGKREIFSQMAFRRHQPFDWLVALEASFSSGTVYVDDAIVFHRIHGRNQSNAPVKPNLSWRQRRSLGRLYAEVQSTFRDRFSFLGRLEHLAYSSVVERPVAHRFAHAAALCRNAWYLPGTTRPISRHRLLASLTEALEPLASSKEDWALAGRYLTDLVRSPFHPKSLGRATRKWMFS